MQDPPPYQPSEQNPNAAGDESKAKTGLGLDANLGAALGYPVGIVAIIVFIMEKTNRFARFHALQSILFHVLFAVLAVVFSIVFAIITAVASSISETLACIAMLPWLLFLVLVLIYIAGLLFAAFKAYGGAWFKLPIIGNMAEKIINK
ncbi:MAG TPA: hypothetical protein VN643_16975 [Pyrinomonadaceae bacterium]|nr:hypothetical protein [Pyrinomonadaceae bacterium]